MPVMIDIEMPESCYYCPCCSQAESCCEDDYCNLLDKELKLFNDVLKRRHNDCPLKEVPSGNYSKWIPTSVRNPDRNGNYLIQVDSSDNTASITFITVDHFNEGGTWLHYPQPNKWKKVVAWMELPELYKGKENKTE